MPCAQTPKTVGCNGPGSTGACPGCKTQPTPKFVAVSSPQGGGLALVSGPQAKALQIGAHKQSPQAQPGSGAVLCTKAKGAAPVKPLVLPAKPKPPVGPTLLKPKPPPPEEHLIKLGWAERPAKVYENSAQRLVARATTTPDADATWTKLTWSEGGAADGVHATANFRKITAGAAGDRKITVNLGSEEASIDLHVRRWPELKLIALKFDDSLQVLNDGAAKIDKLFDKRWESGRKDPGSDAGTLTADYQSPVAYERNKKVAVIATFEVVRGPIGGDVETVDLFGKGAFADGTSLDWKTTVSVKGGDTEITTAAVTSTTALPNKVMFEPAFSVAWEQSQPEGPGRTAITGASKNMLYVLLGAPQAKLYWTLVHISCEKGKDQTSEAAFVPAAYQAFQGTSGDGKGIRRKGDGQEMAYYREGTNTPQDVTVQFPKGLLSNATGTGRCGGWARMLVHALEMHGVASKVVSLVPEKQLTKRDGDLCLLVRNLNFTGPGTLPAAESFDGLYSHVAPAEVAKVDGVAGQGKTNPQFVFGDHAVVGHGGTIYDPSYGTNPVVGGVAYEAGAIAGFGSWSARYAFQCADAAATRQTMTKACCQGYVGYQGRSFAQVAADVGCATGMLWGLDVNAALRDSLVKKHSGFPPDLQAKTPADQLASGSDSIFVPRHLAKTPMLEGY